MTRLKRETVRTKRHARHISYSSVGDSEDTFEIKGRELHTSVGSCFWNVKIVSKLWKHSL